MTITKQSMTHITNQEHTFRTRIQEYAANLVYFHTKIPLMFCYFNIEMSFIRVFLPDANKPVRSRTLVSRFST